MKEREEQIALISTHSSYRAEPVDEVKDELECARKEIAALKAQLSQYEVERPILINKYRDNDPLLLAIQIRNSEWVRYDPENDRPTRGNQNAIIKELEDKGFSNIQAKAIEMVACPIRR
ncbi:hypothetical protein D3C75_1121220 [compost metagenome]